MKTTGFLIIGLVLVAGCVQQGYVPLTELHLEGANEIYTFANDIRATLRTVSVNDPEGIKTIANTNDFVALVFDGSSPEDNAYFTVVVTDLNQKIPVYYAYQGRLFQFIPYYYLGDEWFDRTGKNITKPDFTVPIVWLQGPSTGAADTSLNLVNNTIYLSGTDYRNLTMAGDRLSLLFFSIDEISDITGA